MNTNANFNSNENEDLNDLTLTELFAEADRIGNKYLTAEEQEEFQRLFEEIMGYPSNNIQSAGFPEAQILPHCNGNAQLCGELSAIYHYGQEFPITGNPTLDRICQRLTKVSGYGLFAHLIN
jgi:hypothetical protein